jgi:hypothetical protein
VRPRDWLCMIWQLPMFVIWYAVRLVFVALTFLVWGRSAALEMWRQT